MSVANPTVVLVAKSLAVVNRPGQVRPAIAILFTWFPQNDRSIINFGPIWAVVQSSKSGPMSVLEGQLADAVTGWRLVQGCDRI